LEPEAAAALVAHARRSARGAAATARSGATLPTTAEKDSGLLAARGATAAAARAGAAAALTRSAAQTRVVCMVAICAGGGCQN
jgi:hypothetical protein